MVRRAWSREGPVRASAVRARAGMGRAGAERQNRTRRRGPSLEVVAAEGMGADLAGDESDAAPIVRDVKP
jgi:hypothetical protein